MKYRDYKVEDFLDDKSFKEWILSGKYEHEIWSNFENKFPENKENFTSACIIFETINQIKKDSLPDKKKNLIWDKVLRNSTKKSIQLNYFKRIAAAAAIILLISGAYCLYNISSIKEKVKFSKQIRSLNQIETNKTVLITTNNNPEILSSKESIIKYQNNGEIEVKGEKVINQKIYKNEAVNFNQIVVPHGKRSKIILSDGTVMWLNSGSKAVYPILFNSKKREVYIEGEAFFDVKHDNDKSFIVKTRDIQVKVLGTSFNISCYTDETETKVLLVEGSLQAKIGVGKSVLISPQQLLKYNSEKKDYNIENANIFEHIGWKDGWMLFNSEELGNVMKKLSRYYNIEIEYSEEDLKYLHISGKLDLKDSILKIMETISKAAPINYFMIDGKVAVIRIEGKNNIR